MRVVLIELPPLLLLKRGKNHRTAFALLNCLYNYRWKHRSLKGEALAIAHGLEDHD